MGSNIMNNLPLELLGSILYKVFHTQGIKPLLGLRAVSKKWRTVIDDDWIWVQIARSKYSGAAISLGTAKIHYQTIEKLHKLIGTNLHQMNSYSVENALHYATKNQWEASTWIPILIQHGVSPFQPNLRGYTPLHAAVHNLNLSAVRILSQIEGLVDMCDYQGRTALHIAAMVGSPDLCRVLLHHGAKVTVRDNQQQTPLHIAAKQGDVNVCRAILTVGGWFALEQQDINRNTPLLLAAMMGFVHCVETLVEEYGANISATNARGQSLHDIVQFPGRSCSSAFLKWANDHQTWTPHTLSCHQQEIHTPSQNHLLNWSMEGTVHYY